MSIMPIMVKGRNVALRKYIKWCILLNELHYACNDELTQYALNQYTNIEIHVYVVNHYSLDSKCTVKADFE